MEKQFKLGDTVILINDQKAPEESSNWSEKEGIELYRKHKITRFNHEWIQVDNGIFTHPQSKFKLYKRPKSSKPKRTELEEKFISFLKEHNTLIPFITNLAMYGFNKTAQSLSAYMKNKSHATILLVDAFWWEETSEGWYYWRNLDDLWQNKAE